MNYIQIQCVISCLIIMSCKPSDQQSGISSEGKPLIAENTPSTQLNQKDEEMLILESIIRHQIANGDPSNAARLGCTAYIVGYLNEDTYDLYDPDESLIKRLDDVQLEVKPFSQCRKDSTGVFDIKTNSGCYLLTLGKVKWDNDRQTQVLAGYYSNAYCAAEQIFYVDKFDGKWIVVKEDRISTS